jgi:predicted dehydrogenase
VAACGSQLEKDCPEKNGQAGARRKGTDRKGVIMNVAILGAGNIAHKMAKTLTAMEGVEAYAVAARDLDRAKEFAGTYGIRKAYGSYEEMVRDPQIDLVYISTVIACHAEHMKLCLEHGKPVLCEKPFTVNAAQAKEVIELGKQKNLLVAEAIWTRYLPMRKVMDDVLASGIIGKPVSLTANLGEAISQYPRLARMELGGGAFMDMGVYTVNFALMMFGSAIKKIHSIMIPYETGVDGMSNTTLVYDDGKMAMLHSNMLAYCDKKGMIFGEKGFIEILRISNCEGIRVYDHERKITASYETPRQITGFEYQVEACKRALEANRIECTEMPHAEIIKVLEIMDEIRGIWGLKYPME